MSPLRNRNRNRYQYRWPVLAVVLIIIPWMYFHYSVSSPATTVKISKESYEFVRQNLNNPAQAVQVEAIWREIIHKFIPLPLDQVGGSHAIPLLAAVLLTNGSILELGCGSSSTSLLHNLTTTLHRYLLTADSNKHSLSQFTASMSGTPWHKFQDVVDWNDIGNDRQWSVVLVDNTPDHRRIHDLIKYAYRSQVIVLHDSESNRYMYEKAAPFFPHKYTYRHLSTYTDVWSTTESLLIDKVRKLSEQTTEWVLPLASKKN